MLSLGQIAHKVPHNKLGLARPHAAEQDARGVDSSFVSVASVLRLDRRIVKLRLELKTALEASEDGLAAVGRWALGAARARGTLWVERSGEHGPVAALVVIARRASDQEVGVIIARIEPKPAHTAVKDRLSVAGEAVAGDHGRSSTGSWPGNCHGMPADGACVVIQQPAFDAAGVERVHAGQRADGNLYAHRRCRYMGTHLRKIFDSTVFLA